MGWGCGDGWQKVICEIGKEERRERRKRISGKEFKVEPKEEEGSAEAAGCAAVVLDFTGSLRAACAPHPATPAVCAQSRGTIIYPHAN